jgi:hypothetical protein
MDRTSLIGAAMFGIGLLGAEQSGAQGGPPVYPLFTDSTPLELTIRGPFEQLEDDDEERPEYPAVIELAGTDGERIALDLEVRIRGNSRVHNCNFPPLRLDFPRDAVSGTVFEGQNELKLVTLCKRSDSYRDYLAKEFLIYKMWHALTDRSFRTRWATVEYVYTDARRDKTVVEPAFLIEADREVAERLGMEVVDIEKIDIASLDVPYTTLLILFQYLIANPDWAVLDGPGDENCCHNGKVIRNREGRLIVLPYDFDNTGLINAEYAVPPEKLPIDYVTQRLYRGFCVMNGEVAAAIAQLDTERENLMAIMDSEPISERGRSRAVRFLEDSFEALHNPRVLERRIYGNCR